MSILVTDNFTRANEAPLGNFWTNGASEGTTFALSSNLVVPTDLTFDTSAYYNNIVWPDDQYARAILTTTSTAGGGTGPGLCLRHAVGAQTYYRFNADHAASNNVQLARFDAGGFAQLWLRTQAWTDGDIWQFEVQGFALRVFVNGVEVGADFTDVDANKIASGSPGLAYSSTAAAASFDAFEGGDFGGGGGGVQILVQQRSRGQRPGAFKP